MYADYQYFKDVCPGITESEFDAAEYKATRILDQATSGVDNVKKLKVAMPTNDDDKKAVKICFCELVQAVVYLNRAKAQAMQTLNLEEIQNGYTPKLIKSVSAGGESITYETGASIYGNKYTEAAKTSQGEKAIYNEVIDQLRGIGDKNGVNLLYQGPYPMEVSNV